MMPHYLFACGLTVLGILALEGATFASGLSAEGALTLSSLGPSLSGALKRKRGRPRKFNAPSRAVTLTLPESVIAALSAINRDLSRAVVSLASRRMRKNGHEAAELSVFGRRAVITVQPRPSLATRTGVELVPLPDGRALISMDQPRSIADLELVLDDALDDPALSADDRRVFEGVRDILRTARRSNDVTLLQRSIILLEASKRPVRAVAPTAAAAARGKSR